MKHVFAAVLAAGLCASAGTAFAGDPVSSAVGRFFSAEPGRSSPERPDEFGGDSCRNTPRGTAGVWWGRFAGGTISSPDGGETFRNTHTAQGCFSSRRDCEAWMLALKERYNSRPIHNQCRAGYEPGAPVPPWWAPET